MPLPPPSGRLSILALLASLAALVGPSCKPFNSIGYSSPNEGRIQAVAEPVLVWGRIATSFDPATAVFEIDGVDIGAALGLVPPFVDESGIVMVGPDAVTVSGFSFDPSGNVATQFALFLSGLPAGGHTFTTTAERNGNPLAVDRGFVLVDGFDEELATLAGAGLVGGPRALGSNVLVNQSLGQAIAAPPVAMPGGGSLRSGHIEAAEGRIAGGGP